VVAATGAPSGPIGTQNWDVPQRCPDQRVGVCSGYVNVTQEAQTKHGIWMCLWGHSQMKEVHLVTPPIATTPSNPLRPEQNESPFPPATFVEWGHPVPLLSAYGSVFLENSSSLGAVPTTTHAWLLDRGCSWGTGHLSRELGAGTSGGLG
jgi:hypothetical protein